MLTTEMYFGEHSPNDEELRAADDLLLKVNSLLQELGIKEPVQTSGFRTIAHNAAIGGAPNSLHCLAHAIDLDDKRRIIGSKLYANLDKLKSRNLAMEDLAYCVRANGNKWVHLQNILPKSGKTVFVPYVGAPKIF